jgi:hypothetical protein
MDGKYHASPHGWRFLSTGTSARPILLNNNRESPNLSAIVCIRRCCLEGKVRRTREKLMEKQDKFFLPRSPDLGLIYSAGRYVLA